MQFILQINPDVVIDISIIIFRILSSGWRLLSPMNSETFMDELTANFSQTRDLVIIKPTSLELDGIIFHPTFTINKHKLLLFYFNNWS